MLEQLRAIALQTQQAQVPTQLLFATVSNLAPLTVQVDNRFYLTAPALMTLEPHTHLVNQMVTGNAAVGGGSHSHVVAQHQTEENVPYLVGERVALLRNSGGQSYLLLGRVAV